MILEAHIQNFDNSDKSINSQYLRSEIRSENNLQNIVLKEFLFSTERSNILESLCV